MANPNTIENVLNTVALPDNGTERLKAFYEDRQELGVATEVNLQDLRESIEGLDSLDAKIVALIVQISGLDAAKSTPAWSRLSDDEKHFFGDEHSHEGHNHGGVPLPPEPGIAGPAPLPEGYEAPVAPEAHEDEVTTLRREIDNMLKQGEIGNVPGAATLIKAYEEKLKDPGLNAAHLKTIRDSLNKLQSTVAGFEATNAQDIIDRIQNYNESREEKTNEGNMLLFGAIVHDIYKLGYSISFGRGGSVTVTGGSEQGGAEKLQTSFNGKPVVVDWLKRGLVINSSHWTDFMNSYPSQSTATVEKYISTFYKPGFTGTKIDADLLASSDSGGFDIQGPDGKWIVRGMNVYSVAAAAQQAARKWKEMGYQSPLQKSNPKTMKFAEFAYGVAKYGFAAASVWKGTKALWKTIFGDEEGMKAAWGDFGKTLAWTGAVWYGGDVVRTVANDLKSEMDLPNYVESIKSRSTEEGKYGMYDGFEAIWEKIGGGIMPGMLSTAGVLEAFMPSTVPAHQFKEMWEILISGQKGTEFLNTNISTLSKALDNQYHTKNGSHVGGIREFFYDMGSTGKDIYDKFFIGRSTGEDARTFLRAIADYRSEESFPGANDQIEDRNQPISTLFATGLAKKEVVPGNFDDEMKDVREAWGKTGRAAVELGLVSIAFVGDMVHLGIEGVKSIVEFPMEKWRTLTAEQKANVVAGIRTVGLATATGLLFTFGPGGWIGVALKGVATAATGWSLFDNFKGSINIDTGEVLSGVRGIFQQIYNLPFGIPDNIKTLIQPYLDPNVPLTETAARQLIAELKANVTNPAGVALIGLLEGLLPDAPTAPSPVPVAPGGGVETPEQYKTKILGVISTFTDTADNISVTFYNRIITSKEKLKNAISGKIHLGQAVTKADFVFPSPNSDSQLSALENALR